MKTKIKKCLGILIAGAIIIYLFQGFAYALKYLEYQNTGEKWIYRYKGPGNKSDQANDIKYNQYDGKIYIACKTSRNNTYSNFTVISLNPNGDTNWVHIDSMSLPVIKRDNSANVLAFDAQGCIYAAGYSGTMSGTVGKNIFVKKINALTGTTMDSCLYNGPGNQDDEALAMDINPNTREIYVAGYTTHSMSNKTKDFIILKLDTTLTVTRTFIYNGPADSSDQANAISVNYTTSGGPYVFAGGYVSTLVGRKDFTIVKLDTSLTDSWVYVLDGDGHSADEVKTIHPTQPYAVGYTTGNGTGKDFTVMRIDLLNPYPFPVWLNKIDGPGHLDDECNAVDFYGSEVWTAGYLTDSVSGKDQAVLVFNWTNGSETKRYIYDGPGSGDDVATSVKDCYVGGYCTSDSNGFDFTVLQHYLEYNDTLAWAYLYDGAYSVSPAQGNDVCSKIAVVDSSIFAAGYSRETEYNGVAVIKVGRYFPPTIPILISPANSVWLNDTTVTFCWHKSCCPDPGSGSQYLAYYIGQFAKDSAFTNPVDFNSNSDTVYVKALPDTIWFWRVRAREQAYGGHLSAWSEIRTFSFDRVSPNTPTLLSPINAAILLDTSVTLQWQAVDFKGSPPAPVRYVLQIDNNGTFTAPMVQDTLEVTTIMYNLMGDALYYWRVKAYDLAGNQGSYAPTWHFDIDLSPPLIDSTTVLHDTPSSGPFGVYSKVTDISGVDSVRLYFKRMEDPDWFYYDMAAGGNWYFKEIPAVSLPEDTVKYYIWAKDNAERTSQDPSTDYYWFIANHNPAVQDLDNKPAFFSFSLGSNPAKGKALFNLALPQDASISLRVYDVSGRLIDIAISGRKSAGYYQIPWTAKTNAGVYFYTFESPGHKESGKLVLIH